MTPPPPRRPGPAGSREEPLAQQHSEVGGEQIFELLSCSERLVRHVAGRPNGVEHPRQPRVELRRRHLQIDQAGHPRGMPQLVLEPRDVHPGSDPTVSLPVHPHEHVALPQISQIQTARRMRPRAQLEHHRRQLQPLHGTPGRPPLLGQLLHRRGHEHPQPLVWSEDHGAHRNPQSPAPRLPQWQPVEDPVLDLQPPLVPPQRGQLLALGPTGRSPPRTSLPVLGEATRREVASA